MTPSKPASAGRRTGIPTLDAMPAGQPPPPAHHGVYGMALRASASARALALAGGRWPGGEFIVSIVGRKMLSTRVPGDVELLQLRAAPANASFFFGAI